METGVFSPVQPHHFTPFATLLFQLPSAINKVFGTFDTRFYWSYDAVDCALVVEVWWIKGHEPHTTARRITTVRFDRCEYSYARVVEQLSTEKVDNSVTVQNV